MKLNSCKIYTACSFKSSKGPHQRKSCEKENQDHYERNVTVRVDFYVGCSPNKKPHLRLMRHRLDKERGRHLFSIPNQDVNNVPPSKHTRSNPWENTTFISATLNTFYKLHAWCKSQKQDLDDFVLAKWKRLIMEIQREHSWGQPLEKAALSFSKACFGKHDGTCVTGEHQPRT